MLTWLRNVLGVVPASELESLQAEVVALKASGSQLVPLAGSTPLFGSRDLGTAREQYRHCKGWVWAAIRPIAQRIAGQPVRVAIKGARPGRRKALGLDGAPLWVRQMGADLEPLPDHPLLQALADPNPVHVGWSLMFMTVASLECTGRAYWWIDQGEAGETQLWPLAAHWVEPVHTRDRLYDSFIVRPAGWTEPFTVPGDRMVHFSYPDPSNPILGAFSPLQAVARGIVADENIQDAQVRTFTNGLHPGLAIVVGRHPDVAGVPGQRPVLTKEQRAQLLGAIKAAYRGVMRWDDPIILDGMIENVFKVSPTSKEMDWLNSSNLTKQRIFQGFGVNAIIAGEIQTANRASATAAEDHFLNSCVNPKVNLLSQTLTSYFRWHFQEPRLVVWIEEATTKDPELEWGRLKDSFDRGACTVNELRQGAGLPPLKAGNVVMFNVALVQAAVSREGEPGNEDPYEVLLADQGDSGGQGARRFGVQQGDSHRLNGARAE